ncbi:MAG: hypothetical protein AB7L84_11760 [Acidimicrobiia bacterium]
MTANEPGAPGDGDTMTEVLHDFERDGFADDVALDEAGSFHWRPCGHVAAPADTVVERFHRLEGASDPADMTIVLGLRCPTCGRRGVTVLAYGENAGPLESDALARLPFDLGGSTPGL